MPTCTTDAITTTTIITLLLALLWILPMGPC
jgi:hypothetical protein